MIYEKIKRQLKRFISPLGYQIYLLVNTHIKDTRQKGINREKIKHYLLLNKPICLELGSISKREGWLTLDLYYDADIICDMTKGLPFPDNSVEKVYCSHLLEHFYHRDLINLLTEVKRILKPGGSISVVVPDASIYINAYSHGNDISSDIGENNPFLHFHSAISTINYIAYLNGEHKYMFDQNELISILDFMGFLEARKREFDKDLDLLGRHKESIYAIAIK